MTCFVAVARAPLGAFLASCLLAACQPPTDKAEAAGSDAGTLPTGTGSDADTSEEVDSAASSGGSNGGAGTEPVDLCDVAGEPKIELGHGDQVYEPLEARNAQLIAGVQGGFHIFVGIRGRHLDASDSAVARITGSVAGVEVGFSAPFTDLVCTTDGLEATNLLLIWDADPDFLAGKTANIKLELTDAAGTVVTAEGDVVIDGL